MSAEARPEARTEVRHASCVALAGRGLLILGPSGCGKSTLALALIALGAELVADDRTELSRDGDAVLARAPQALQGLIEARGIGILRLPARDSAALALVADLGRPETERLPPDRRIPLMGCDLPLVLGPLRDHLPASIHCYLAGARHA